MKTLIAGLREYANSSLAPMYMDQAATAIEKLEAERERNLQSIVDGNNIILKKNDEIAQLKAELAAMKLIGWLDGRGRFFYAADPLYQDPSPGMTPVYAAPGANLPQPG